MSIVLRSVAVVAGIGIASILIANPTFARTPDEMMAKCRDRAHKVLRTRLPDIETKYEGQRTDGTHAVNGTAYINGVAETFQCSFDKAGHKIVHFVVNNPEGEVGSSGGSSSKMPSKDEQVCLQAVGNTTNNPDIVLLRTETSEANNAVIVGVGPRKAPWQCLVKDGVVAEIMSLTDEGAN